MSSIHGSFHAQCELHVSDQNGTVARPLVQRLKHVNKHGNSCRWPFPSRQTLELPLTLHGMLLIDNTLESSRIVPLATTRCSGSAFYLATVLSYASFGCIGPAYIAATPVRADNDVATVGCHVVCQFLEQAADNNNSRNNI